MRLICKAFQALVLTDGSICLEVENPKIEHPGDPVPIGLQNEIIHDEVLYVPEVARIMKVSRSTLYHLIASNKLGGVPMIKEKGRRPYILASELRKYLLKHPAAIRAGRTSARR